MINAAETAGGRLAAVTLATVTAFTLSACHEAPPAPEVTASASAAAGLVPEAVCVRPNQSDPKAEQKARACERAMSAGSLVVVSFDAPDSVKNTLTADLSSLIATGTGNKVRVKTEVVEASPAAKAKLKTSMGAKGCIDPIKSEEFASTIAGQTMPGLRNYDFVLGVSNADSCTGVPGSTRNSRSGDVFLGAVAKAATHDHLARGALVTAAHEFGHEVTLGHDGDITYDYYKDISGRYRMGSSFDLGKYLQTTQYQEYSPDNMMGVLIGPEYASPDVIQEAMLDWPQAFIPGSPANPKETLDKPLVFDEAAFQAGKFAAMKLQQPVQFTDGQTNASSKGQAGTHQFTELAVLPRISGGHNYGIELALVNPAVNVTATLGSLGNTPGENHTSVISYHGQRLEIATVGAKTIVRQLA
jgi:hypothetical protein